MKNNKDYGNVNNELCRQNMKHNINFTPQRFSIVNFTNLFENSLNLIFILRAASWRKRLGARLPPLGSRVRVSVPLCGFRGGRNGVWVGFLGISPVFPYHKFHSTISPTLISSISFHIISPCDGASGVVGRHPCYSRTYNLGASSHLIPRPDLVVDTS